VSGGGRGPPPPDIYFNFNGAKLPDISSDREKMWTLMNVFEDTFFVPLFFEDRYEIETIKRIDAHTAEGPYGYTDRLFDVTIKNGDIVIDAGAWIGDFSAYATTRGGIVYAFDPVNEMFELLKKTSELNRGDIIPVHFGLGDRKYEVEILASQFNSGATSVYQNNQKDDKTSKELIAITTLDNFVEENNLERIDFIKADIEGAERDMLKGAVNTLKKYAPKLAICTYHLPDDQDILEKIILEANPAYTIRHLRHKLFAQVIK
jgi:FkbM family methyltransferase